LYQVNTRVWLTELAKGLNRPATLDDIPDSFFDWLVDNGFTWAYFLSVWQTGEIGRNISRNHPGWKEGFQVDIPDLTDEDICGSGFAITDYTLSKAFGQPDSLIRLRKKLNDRGLKLMLDLVPNHTAIDHFWVTSHPEYYVQGDENALAAAPQNFIRVGERIFAHGRDPYFDGWPDTLQLNYGAPEFCEAMVSELKRIATTCDGLRCDMAMLVLPDVFQRTWGIDIEPFWSNAIDAVRESHPDFAFMAEVYWDREWDLQQLGFDFTYDKRLYDRLRQNEAKQIREHFFADLDYQKRSARFLENHDEPRAAGTFSPGQHKAAAIVTFLSPGLRFFHQGEFEGYRKRVSVHISRKPKEDVDADIAAFYKDLLNCLELPVVHTGDWELLECAPAWDTNWTNDCFIAFSWTGSGGEKLIAIVNYSGHQSQCHVIIPQADPVRGGGGIVSTRSGGGVDSTRSGALNAPEKLLLSTPQQDFDWNDDRLSVDLAPWGYLVLKA